MISLCTWHGYSQSEAPDIDVHRRRIATEGVNAELSDSSKPRPTIHVRESLLAGRL